MPHTDTDEQVNWRVIWNVVRGENKIARRRALRETLTVLAVALLPLLLGAFFSYVAATRSDAAYPNYLVFAVRATLAGQMFLLFLSLAGAIFSRLWDPDGPRYAFSGILNVVCLIGAVMAGGLLALDTDMKTFAFWPVGAMSLLFFVIGVVYYYILAIPSYLSSPDIQGGLAQQGAEMGDALEKRMTGNAP